MPDTCLHPECDEESIERGLCFNHWYTAWRLVADNKTTWKKLQQNNKCLRETLKKPKRNWFLD